MHAKSCHLCVHSQAMHIEQPILFNGLPYVRQAWQSSSYSFLVHSVLHVFYRTSDTFVTLTFHIMFILFFFLFHNNFYRAFVHFLFHFAVLKYKNKNEKSSYSVILSK